MGNQSFLGIDNYNLVWLCCGAWLACLLLLFQFCRSKRSLGLPLAYGLLLTMIHGGGFIYLFESYDPNNNPSLAAQGAGLDVTATGLAISTFGLIVFTIGTQLGDYIFSPRIIKSSVATAHPLKFGRSLMLMGVIFFFAVAPLSSYIPSGMSIASSGVQLTIVGICLFAYASLNASIATRFSAFAATLALPIATILLMGFVGFGFVALVEICCFFVRQYRIRGTTIVGVLFSFWFAMSFYVTYMKGRDEIRGKVWNNASIPERFDIVGRRFLAFEIFDPSKEEHLHLIDIRLNQNFLVGKSYNHIQSVTGGAFFNGESIWIASVAWIPRILWPGKPTFGGSGQFASQFTGMRFATGTSVGVGIVMELYSNFGIPGVVFGFLIMAVIIRYLDNAAATSLSMNQLWDVTKYLLLGFSLMQPGGLLAECVASFAASYILMIFFRWLMSKLAMFSAPVPTRYPAKGVR